MSTVEEIRDQAHEFESRRIEGAAWEFARDNADVAAWREAKPGESAGAAARRLIGREFGKVLEMDFDRFCDLTGFEVAFDRRIAA